MKHIKIEIKEFTTGGVVWKILECKGLFDTISLSSSTLYTRQRGVCGVDKLSKQQIIDAIQAEFDTAGELKIGEMCEVRYCNLDKWKRSIFVCDLGEKMCPRFVCEGFVDKSVPNLWQYARPIKKRIDPTITGDIYEWRAK